MEKDKEKIRKRDDTVIGILTFYWADDYGAMLQAYALKTYLERQEETVEIIPYAPLKLRGRYHLIPINATYKGGKWKCYRDLRSFCWKMCFFKQYLRRRESMRYFRKQYLTEKKTIEEARKLWLQSYDFVLVGSDQVWNSEITFGLDDAYIGDIEKGNQCKLVAYGASFGKDMPPKNEWQKFKKSLSENFLSVSLREKGAADFVGQLLNRQVTNVLDPVLLLEKDTWEVVERKPQEKEYILFYATEPQEYMLRFTTKLSKVSCRPVIQLSYPYKRKQRNEVQLHMDAGPEEFIGYFHHASCVITNSFHGLVFSVLFEKQFLVFQHSSYHARIKNLLEKLSLEHRLMKPGEKMNLSCMEEKIDWLAVRKCLQVERECSERFIKEGMKKI